MKRFFFSIGLYCIFYFLSSVSSANADVTCQPIYGGGQTCVSTGNILIDKKVFNPGSQLSWVDNLGVNDEKFQPDSTINFQINLTNTGHADIKHIDVKDEFPQFVLFTSGPGKFDQNTKTLTFEVADLKPNEIRIFTVTGKVVEANHLPIDLGIVCTVNQATATTSDAGISQDSAQFCIQRQVLAAQTSKGGFPVFPAPNITATPATGGELLSIISLIPTGILGFFLRKKAINKKQ